MHMLWPVLALGLRAAAAATEGGLLARLAKQCADQPPGPLEYFSSQDEWRTKAAELRQGQPTGCRLRTVPFQLTGSNLLLASQAITLSAVSQALSFAASRTGLPVDFVFRILPGNPTVRSRAFNGSLVIGGNPHDAPEGGHTSHNDDFSLRLDPASGVLTYGLGVLLEANDVTQGESISLIGLDGGCVGRIALPDKSGGQGAQFLGVLSQVPLSGLAFDEDDGEDDISVRTLWFAYCETGSSGSSVLWGAFAAISAGALLVELSCVNPATLIQVRVAAGWSAVWAALALGFGALIHWVRGSRQSALFLTGYVLEESLSVDNLVVFVLIFKEFKAPTAVQHKALLYGVLLSIGLRGLFILIGSWLLDRFRAMLVLFGLVLVWTGGKMATGDGGAEDIGQLRRWTISGLACLGISVRGEWDQEESSQLAVVRDEDGIGWSCSPMLPLFVCLGLCDVMFAFDSIPAILGVTEDVFIVVTSNAFAVLGLRALYWCLAALHSKFAWMQHVLAAALVCVGIKMISGYFSYHLGYVGYATFALSIMGFSMLPSDRGPAGLMSRVMLSLGLRQSQPPRVQGPDAQSVELEQLV